jgi:hypothetical protein
VAGSGPEAPDGSEGLEEPDPEAEDSGDTDPLSGVETGIGFDPTAIGEEVGGAPTSGGGGLGYQSGTLTAGSFDDNLNYESFEAFITEVQSGDLAAAVPALSLGDRMVVRVTDSAGQPVPDAQVVIRPADGNAEGEMLIDVPTRADGRVLLLTGLDGGEDATELEITVEPAGAGGTVTETIPLAEGEWEVELPDVEAKLPSALDLAFVVDTTFSMEDELEFLQVELRGIARTVNAVFPDVDQRYGLVVYRDEGDLYVTLSFDFTPDLDAFLETLEAQFAAGGGDIPEAMEAALLEAEALSWRASDVARVLLLLTDAPPHPEDGERTLEIANRLRGKGVAIYPIAASGALTEAEYILRTAAMMTLSEYLFLTDDSGFGLPHAAPNIPCYVVQRLDQQMIRVLSAELSGERQYPAPDEGIRTVGNPVDGVCLPEN